MNTMTHTYQLTGMTCAGCEAKVKSQLLIVPGITSVEVSKENSTAILSMDHHIPLSELQKAIGGESSKYRIAALHNEAVEQARGWWETYKPIVVLFLLITTVSVSTSISQGQFNWMNAMNNFMAGFFLSFSFFKLINVHGFAESYSMYDWVAKRWKAWGFIYPFVELILGLAFLLNLFPVVTNAVTFVVMSVSLVGVLQSVLNKRKIQCACLGAVFNLPMSTVTIVEDALMIVMSAVMLIIRFI